MRSIGTKAHENVGNSGRGHSQGVPKIFRAPICRAHCAVIFAIAQLSCFRLETMGRLDILAVRRLPTLPAPVAPIFFRMMILTTYICLLIYGENESASGVEVHMT